MARVSEVELGGRRYVHLLGPYNGESMTPTEADALATELRQAANRVRAAQAPRTKLGEYTR